MQSQKKPAKGKAEHYQIGTVTCAPLEQDLVRDFLLAAEKLTADDPSQREEVEEIRARASKRGKSGYYTSKGKKQRKEDRKALWQILWNCSGPYCTFDEHPDDPGNWGFWLISHWREELLEGHGIIVYEVRQIPKNFEGDFLLVTKSGNLIRKVAMCYRGAAPAHEMQTFWEMEGSLIPRSYLPQLQ
ncbi:MAG TPA: hypothetical protein VE030_11185 [Burkholderiales bacterium]|nr:hypothetical protein [Burkholderiales bacterium]